MLAAIAAIALAAQAPPPATLTHETYDAVRRYAAPTARDLTFRSLDWKDSVYEGIVEAQRRDRPILMWLYFGDPRGHC